MKKYSCIAYLLCLFGGFFGLHLLYLRRDKQAFLYWCTLGGYLGLGPLRDLYRIPYYVRDICHDTKYGESLAVMMNARKKPGLNLIRFVTQITVGHGWCFLLMSAVPQEEIFGFYLRPLLFLSPLGSALGTWVVGNIGRQQGDFFWPCIGAFMVLPIAVFFRPALTWSCLSSTLLFEFKAKQWRRTPYRIRSKKRRALYLGLSWLVFSSLWISYMYFNAEVDHPDGQKTKFRDGIINFFNSPMYLEFKKNGFILLDTYWKEGWRKAGANLLTMLDVDGENHALKVLGLTRNATQEEISSQYKKLTKEWHPDKHQGETEKIVANERFVEIVNAHEKLSHIKKRRTIKSSSSST